MRSEIIINKHDYNRVVLTEVQPYELPFIVTNEGLYKYLALDKKRVVLEKIFSDIKTTKPFDFKITKTKSSHRKLSLIHPYGQVSFVDFYRNFHNLVKTKCQNSQFSLRFPVDTALFYVESGNKDIVSKIKDEGVDLSANNPEDTPVYASSFFTYKKYNFLYKFYDSYEFHRIERRFSKLHKFDISKCFENLSPDMLVTAVKSEELVRTSKHSHETFESQFAELISYVNYNRNHGIVIGPEFSRIFAELLFQQSDSEIQGELAKKQLLYGKDYIIKRYVDDYFLFYQDDSNLDVIKKVVLNSLSNYKLFTNESKDEFFARPFVTGVTNAKLAITDYFYDLFADVVIDLPNGHYEINNSFFKYFKVSNRQITRLKSIIKQYDVDYESISGYFLTILRSKLIEISEVFKLSHTESKFVQPTCRFLLMIIEIMFFMYSMDRRVRATYLISESIIQIAEISKYLDYESEMMISDKILQEAKFSIKNELQGNSNVESLNLALSLQTLNTENSLSLDDVKRLINFKESNDELNYFQFVVGLYFIKDNSNFKTLKKDLCESAFRKIAKTNLPLTDSECVHIIFDLLSCPYVEKTEKVLFIEQLVGLEVFPKGVLQEEIFEMIANRSWFVDWSEISIKRLLKKKQLRSPY